MGKKEDYGFFDYASKATIVIPIVVIIIALVLKLISLDDKNVNKQLPIVKSSINITPRSIKTSPKIASSPAKIDLKGPWVCDIKLDSASVSSFIKNKNIYVRYKEKNKTSYFLVKKDCIYNWEKNKFSGKKTCGISLYLDLFDQLSKNTSLSINMLMNFFPKSEMQKLISSNEGKLKTEDVCQKKKVKDEVFKLPKNILFKRMEIKK